MFRSSIDDPWRLARRSTATLLLGLLGTASCADLAGPPVSIYYVCDQAWESVEVERTTLDDGTLVDGTDDVRCMARPWEQCASVERGGVDIASGSLRVEDDTVVVDMALVDFPAELPFSQSGVDGNSLEYEWFVSIDLDADGLDELRIGTSFKLAAAEDLVGDPVKFTQHYVWEVKDSGTYRALGIEPSMMRTDEGLRFEVAVASVPGLEELSDDSVVSFSSFRAGPGFLCRDTL